MGIISKKINIQFVFVLLYLLLSFFLMVRVIGLWGIPVKMATGVYLYICWGFFCFTAYYWYAPYELAKMNVRLPTMAEEFPLQKLTHDILGRTYLKIDIDLRIEESDLYSACAIGRNTVVLSKGIIKDFSNDELRGIIAHEIGHLRDRDTMMVTAYYMAGRLHSLLQLVIRNVFNMRRLMRMFYWKERVLVCVVTILTVLFFASKLILPAVLTFLYLITIRYIDRFFNWAWLVISRYCEYRQDHFAWSLGYGTGLAGALAKSAKSSPQEVRWFYITVCGTHPVVYHRIRKLEMFLANDKNADIKTGMVL